MCSRKCETPATLARLVAAPRLDEEPGGDRVRPVVQLGDDLEPVVQRRVMKLHGVNRSFERAWAEMDAVRQDDRTGTSRFEVQGGSRRAVGPSVRIVRSSAVACSVAA